MRPLPPVPPITPSGFFDPVWPRWLQLLRDRVLTLMPLLTYGSFYDTSVQSAAANTATAVTWDSTIVSNGVHIGTPSSRLVFTVAGTYNMEFSLQFSNSGAAADDVTVWLRQNGVDIPDSCGFVSVVSKHGSADGHMIVSWNEYLTVAAGDYIEMYWATALGTDTIETYPAQTTPFPRPRIPSAAITFTAVAA